VGTLRKAALGRNAHGEKKDKWDKFQPSCEALDEKAEQTRGEWLNLPSFGSIIIYHFRNTTQKFDIENK